MRDAYRTALDFRALTRNRHWGGNGSLPWPEFFPCMVAIESTLETDPAQVERRLKAFGAHCGWVERQSQLSVFEHGLWPEAGDGFDALIAGEFAGAEAGLLVRRVADGWRMTTISDCPDEAGDCLGQDLELAGVDRLPATRLHFGRMLRYRVYLRHDEAEGWYRFAARLLEFHERPVAGR